MKYQSQSPPALRRAAQVDALLTTMHQLERCRAGEAPEGYVDDYLALDWLKWDAGILRLTARGDQVCEQITRNLASRPTQ